MVNSPITCPICRSKVEMKTMRYDLQGRHLVCQKCYEKEASQRKEKRLVTRVDRR